MPNTDKERRRLMAGGVMLMIVVLVLFAGFAQVLPPLFAIENDEDLRKGIAVMGLIVGAIVSIAYVFTEW